MATRYSQLFSGWVEVVRVSVPLRGFSEWRLRETPQDLVRCVSVPLRGFSEWRRRFRRCRMVRLVVSVPLRGFSEWRLSRQNSENYSFYGFSPLTGIQ